jgi:hypothetical protein
MIKPFLLLSRWVQNIDEKWVKVQGRVRPDEIADYYQGINNGTIVVLKCNSSFLLDITIADFDYVLDYYYRHIITFEASLRKAPQNVGEPPLLWIYAAEILQLRDSFTPKNEP